MRRECRLATPSFQSSTPGRKHASHVRRQELSDGLCLESDCGLWTGWSVGVLSVSVGRPAGEMEVTHLSIFGGIESC